MGREPQPRLWLLPQSRAVWVAFVRILIESGEVRPPVDDLANVPGRERLVEFERAVVDDRLEDEGVVAVAVKVLPAPGVQLQVMVDGLLDVLRQGDRSFAPSLGLNPRRPAPVTPADRGSAQVSDLAHPQAGPRQDEQQRVIPRSEEHTSELQSRE